MVIESWEMRKANDGVGRVDAYADADDGGARIAGGRHIEVKTLAEEGGVSQTPCCAQRVYQLRHALYCCVIKKTDPCVRAACAGCSVRDVAAEINSAVGAPTRHASPRNPKRRAVLRNVIRSPRADRLVRRFLSRSMGRVRGVAAGARKTKSRFGSTLERLSHVRIWYYERETRDLVRINQCEMIESFLDSFRDYNLSVVLSLFSEITEAVLPEREAADANFRLLLLASQAVKRTGKAELPLAYFSLWTVKLGGWLPPLGSCARCGKELDEREARYFSSATSVMVCEKCRRGVTRPVIPQCGNGLPP